MTRRIALASTLLTLSGCAGGGSPFAALGSIGNKTSETIVAADTDAPESSLTGSVSTLAHGTRGQFSSMGSAVKSAYTKTTDSVAGLFKGKANTVDAAGNPIDEDDPLRLDNKPQSIGPEVFVANGQLWESTGNFEKAMENYAQALEKEPNNAPALGSIARLNFRQAKHAEAIRYFERAIKAAPNDAALYNDLGLTLSKMKRHEEAAEAIRNALAIAPGTSRYANNLASVHYAAGRPEQAMKTLMEHNKPAVAHFNMAYLEFNDGNYGEARTQLNEALKYEPQATEDTAVQRAVDRSREMLAKLDQTSTKVANVAQAAPQVYSAARNIYDAGKQVVRTNGESYSMSDSTPVAKTVASEEATAAVPNQQAATTAKPSDPSAPTAQPKPATEKSVPATATPATTAPATEKPATEKPTADHPFALPDNFFQTGDSAANAAD